MSHLALFLLGQPRIEREGETIEINRRKAVALLAYLAITAESHSRDVLATLLWPEYDQVAARVSLGTALLALNKALGRHWLDVERKTIGLNQSANIWVDVTHFCRLLAECQTHDHPPEKVCPACPTPLTEAVELYRDDFMAGFSLHDSANFDDWQLFQSEGLRRELVGALKKLVVCHSAREEFEPAIAYVRRWLALEPLHESAHRHLMRLYASTGQRAAALRHYQECAQLFGQEMGMTLQEATTQLYRDIKAGRSPSLPSWSLPRPSHNLPIQPTPFLGREKELTDIADRLQDPACRLLSLIGPGGTGKTRLALQAAVENIQLFPHGTCFVPLAPLDSADLLVPTIAHALKFSFHGEANPKAQLLNYLHEKEMLLVLDNFEHLLEGAGLLAEILQRAPGVKLLVTSREGLNLQWEWLFEIQGLRFPHDGTTAAMEHYSAVQLFLQSASRIHPGFSLSEEEKPFVIRICQFLEGLPLGIELAAAWVQMLSCQEIAQQIEGDLALLATSLRDVPERHRSLQAVFDHSWNLLSEQEKNVFAKLSVFRGGFRAEAADRVAGASLPLLLALVRKSFVRRNTAGRYEMLEVLRQHAAEKLQDKDKIHDLHCEYYAQFLCQRHDHLKGKNQKEALEEIGQEIENVRAGWQWAVQRGNTEAIVKSMKSLALFYEMRSWFQEGEEIFGKAAERWGGMEGAPDELILGQVLARQGRFCQLGFRLAKAKELFHQSLSIFRRLGARKEMAFPLRSVGSIAWRLGEQAEAEQLLQESLTIYKESDDRWGTAVCLSALANVVTFMRKEYTAGKQLYQDSLAIFEELGDQRRVANTLSNLGRVAEDMGEYAEAKQLHQKALMLFKKVGDPWAIANGLNNLGFAFYGLEDCQEAQRCFRQALEIATDLQLTDIAQEALVGIATLVKKQGDEEQALELVVVVLDYPTIHVEVKARAESLLYELKSHLSPQVVEMVQGRARTRESDSFSRDILNRLTGS